MKAVIFDMDGLMIDSERLVLNSLVSVGKKHNFNDITEICTKAIGTNDEETRRIFHEALGDELDYENLRKEAYELYLNSIRVKGIPVKEGLYDCLKKLKAHNFMLSVATSTKQSVAESTLKSIGVYDFFKVTVYGDMVTKSKPNPQIFLKAAELMKISPEQCYVLEDSYNGVKAAYAANMKPIMVPDLLPYNDEIKPYVYEVAENLSQAVKFIIP